MKITPSQLLQSSNKYITNYDCSMIAVEGPNVVGKLNLSNLNIPYETFFVSKLILQPNEEEKPIMYGFLGTDITFLMLKVNYDSNIVASCCNSSSEFCCGVKPYLSYKFEDDGTVNRYLYNLLVLTGTEEHRIPQIYLYNNNDFAVEIEVMVANIGTCSISDALSVPQTFYNLFFNSISSDQIYDIFGNTGSTQLEILDMNYNTQLVISYAEIDVVEIDGSDILITTTHDDQIKLNFLSPFNALQANSRINWVRSDQTKRYLANPSSGSTYPIIDVQAPTITYIPHAVNTLPLNPYITKTDIRYYFINTVVDYADSGETILRDGIISKDNVNVIITRYQSLQQVDQITQDGEYEIVFEISDIAGNTTTDVKTLLVDSQGPEITLKSVTTNTLYLDMPATPFITGAELKDYYVQGVYDVVDGVMNISSVYMSGDTSAVTFSGDTDLIEYVGYYPFKFYATDRVGNIGYSTTIPLMIYETESATINFYDQYSGSTITGTTLTGFTESQLITEMVSGITDEFEPTLDIDSVYVTGVDFPIVSGETYVASFNIVNFSQLTGTTIKTIIT
jgi:hypothetical protein